MPSFWTSLSCFSFNFSIHTRANILSIEKVYVMTNTELKFLPRKKEREILSVAGRGRAGWSRKPQVTNCVTMGRTIRKVMRGGGGGGVSVCRNFFFFAQSLCRNFFSVDTLCTNFFFFFFPRKKKNLRIMETKFLFIHY